MWSLEYLNSWKSLSLEFSCSKENFQVFKRLKWKPLLVISFYSFSLQRGNVGNNCDDFLKKIWIYCINIIKNFIAWQDYLFRALFIIINSIVFQWTEVYVLVNTTWFKFKKLWSTKNKLMIWQTYINNSFLKNSWRETC